MNKEAIQGFNARITQASRSELVVILYEIILTEIEEARNALKEDNLQGFNRSLKQAQKGINELIATLDYQHSISYDLLSLYLYTNKMLISSMLKKDSSALDSAIMILEKLLVGFQGVSKEDKSGPVMRNTQQVYAGLTYGKGTLNETYLDPSNGNRGFIA